LSNELKVSNVNKGPKAGEVHPVPVRIVQEAPVSQQPSVYDPVARKMRDLQRRQIEADELDIDLDIETKKTTIRELRARQNELDRSRRDSVNRRGTPDEAVQSISVADAQKLADLPEEKRQAVLAVMAAANAQNEGSNSMLPLLLMGYSQNHAAPDIQQFGETILNAMQTGMQLVAGNSGAEDVKDKMLLMAFEKALNRPPDTPRTDALDTIKSLKEAGLIYTPADVSKMLSEAHSQGSTVPVMSGPSNADLELKRLDLQTQIDMKKIDSNQALEMAKLGLEKQKSENLTNLVTRVSNTVGRAMANGEISELDDKGVTAKGLPPNTPKADVREEKCPVCQNPIVIPEPDKARQIKCIKCGKVLDYDPSK